MNPGIEALEQVGGFLLEHADLVGDLVDVIQSGGSQDATKKLIRAALREIKVKVSDQAFREELGLDDSDPG